MLFIQYEMKKMSTNRNLFYKIPIESHFKKFLHTESQKVSKSSKNLEEGFTDDTLRIQGRRPKRPDKECRSGYCLSQIQDCVTNLTCPSVDFSRFDRLRF